MRGAELVGEPVVAFAPCSWSYSKPPIQYRHEQEDEKDPKTHKSSSSEQPGSLPHQGVQVCKPLLLGIAELLGRL